MGPAHTTAYTGPSPLCQRTVSPSQPYSTLSSVLHQAFRAAIPTASTLSLPTCQQPSRLPSQPYSAHIVARCCIKPFRVCNPHFFASTLGCPTSPCSVLVSLGNTSAQQSGRAHTSIHWSLPTCQHCLSVAQPALEYRSLVMSRTCVYVELNWQAMNQHRHGRLSRQRSQHWSGNQPKSVPVRPAGLQLDVVSVRVET
jgi:hypothetical protein